MRAAGYRTMLAAFAASALIAGKGRTALAGDPSVTTPAYASAVGSPSILEQATGPSLANAGIRLRGYAEGGYVFSFDRPETGLLGHGIIFNEKSDDLVLDQVSLVATRDVYNQHDHFDIGFVGQVIYGSDARFTQANGTNFYGSHYANDNSDTIPRIPFPFPPVIVPAQFPQQPGTSFRNGQQPSPEAQFDVIQAAITFALPVGDGLWVTAGKFVTPWGLETIDPTQNLLYSHSYTYGLATPKTLTGVTVSAGVNDKLTVTGGLVVGYDQSLKDNNDIPSLILQGHYEFDQDWQATVSMMVGPEQTSNRSNYRWLLDGTSEYVFNRDLKLGVEGLFGYEPDSGTDYRLAADQTDTHFIQALSTTGKDAYWLSGVAYMEQKIDPDGQINFVMRGEYFNDVVGAHGLATEVWSATFGLKIVPFPDDKLGSGLVIRPEIRWDYANTNMYDDNGRNTQISIGADVMYKF